MLRNFIFFVISATVGLTACHSKTSNDGNQPETPVQNSTQGVETNEPNSQYKPAFEGQTRVGAVKTQTPYEGKLLTKELEKPWGIVALPDGRLLITEKEGTMRIATNIGTLSAPITGLPKVDSDAQGGLLGVTI